MKLYTNDLSPYSARVRMQIYAKGIDGIEFAPPPGGLGSKDFAEVTFIAKIPALEIAPGDVLPESDVICEYLEDAHPEPPLRPEDPRERAQMRLVSRICDLYILGPMFTLLPHLNPQNRDQKVVEAGLSAIGKGLDGLEHYLGRGYAVGGGLTLADCALVPTVFFAETFLPLLAAEPPLKDRAKLHTYRRAIDGNDHGARIWEEMTAELARRRAG